MIGRSKDCKKNRPPEGGLSLGRKRPKEGICDVSHCTNIALQRSKSNPGADMPAMPRVTGWPQCHRGPACAAPKKEAARRRPESREETPKEGMYGNRRTVFNVAPIEINARILSRRSASC
jgi:hypothetical protein